MNLFELTFSHYLYQNITNYDDSLTDLNTIINYSLDLNNKTHIQGLINWLNRWGCRHISIESHEELKNNILIWWNTHIDLIDKIKIEDKKDIIKIFDSLSAVIVSDTDKKLITLGPTAAAKILFIINNKIFIPWDIKIRKDYGNSGSAYYKLIIDANNEIFKMKKELKINENKWKNIIRNKFPNYISDMKLMDEYYWITKTKNIIINKEQIENIMEDKDV